MTYKPAFLTRREDLFKLRETNRERQFKHYHKTQLMYCRESIRRAEEELAILKQAENPDRPAMIHLAEVRDKAMRKVEEHTEALKTNRPRNYAKIPEEIATRIAKTVEAHVKETMQPHLGQVVDAMLPEQDEWADAMAEVLEEMQNARRS
jgi:hypothetical protein